jgi:hypothetical protein
VLSCVHVFSSQTVIAILFEQKAKDTINLTCYRYLRHALPCLGGSRQRQGTYRAAARARGGLTTPGILSAVCCLLLPVLSAGTCLLSAVSCLLSPSSHSNSTAPHQEKQGEVTVQVSYSAFKYKDGLVMEGKPGVVKV